MHPASAAIRSNSWRLQQRDSISEAKLDMFTAPLEFTPNSPCLLLSRSPTLHPATQRIEIYTRSDTQTYVNRLVNHSAQLVVKAFRIRARAEREDSLLSEHEVEVRYLLLLTALMRAGVTDCVTVPLAMVVLSREQLRTSGYLTPKQAANMFPEKRKEEGGRREGGGGRYAVLFAEAADQSLTDYLFSACAKADAAGADYMVRAALLQVYVGLAAIHSAVPSFRHNDLHASNILVQRIDPKAVRAALGERLPEGYPLLVEYAVGGRRWQVDLDRAPFRCLLWDMSFASIDANDATRNSLEHVVPREGRFGSVVVLSKSRLNQYCDMHKLTDTLRWVLQQGNGGWKKLSAATQQLFEQVAPTALSYAEKTLADRVKAERQAFVHSDCQHTSPTDYLLYGLDPSPLDEFRVDQTPEAERLRSVYALQKVEDPVTLFTWSAVREVSRFL